MSPVKSHKPSGRVPLPLVLVEGEEKSGKTWAAALLTASPRVGKSWWLDLGEGSGEEYGAVPGARYEVCDHDGTWSEIMQRVAEVRAEAAAARAAGEPPVVLVIDTATDLWNGLKAWVDARFRNSRAGREALAKDPDGELKPSQNLWNDANSRHRRLMTQLMTFPGIVVMTARGKEITEVKNGKPVPNSKVWAVETQKDVPFDATVWVRMFRTQRPIVVGARSVHAGIRPGEEPQPIQEDHDNLLDWLIFDVLKVEPATAEVRDLHHTAGGELTEDERPAEEEPRRGAPATTRAAAEALARAASKAGTTQALDDLQTAVAEQMLPADISAVVTPAQRALARQHEPRVAARGPITLRGWLIACRACIDKGGTSIRDGSDNLTWFSEQIDAANVSSQHYKVIFKPSEIVPVPEVR